MAETTAPQQYGYGYVNEESQIAGTNGPKFGLNSGAFLTKFEFINNAGKGGTEAQALDISFNIGGRDISYRQFPITDQSKRYEKIKGGGSKEIEDKTSKAYTDASMVLYDELASRIQHVLIAYKGETAIKAAFQRRFSDFKEYSEFAKSLLPNNFNEIPLDIFLQYQSEIKDNNPVTYLEMPKKLLHGKYIVATKKEFNFAQVPVKVDAAGIETPLEKYDDNETALMYKDVAAGKVHPFVRTGWFMKSNLAKQQKTKNSGTSTGANNMNAGSNMNAASTGTTASDATGGW